MAFNPSEFNSTGFVAASVAIPGLDTDLQPIFHVEHVQLQFQVASDFVAVQVANNVIILALTSGRILRIDLASPQDVDGGFIVPGVVGLGADLIVPSQILTFLARYPRLGRFARYFSTQQLHTC